MPTALSPAPSRQRMLRRWVLRSYSRRCWGSENAVERAYRRGDLLEKRVQLMEAWARFCTVSMTTDEVIAISAAR